MTPALVLEIRYQTPQGDPGKDARRIAARGARRRRWRGRPRHLGSRRDRPWPRRSSSKATASKKSSGAIAPASSSRCAILAGRGHPPRGAAPPSASSSARSIPAFSCAVRATVRSAARPSLRASTSDRCHRGERDGRGGLPSTVASRTRASSSCSERPSEVVSSAAVRRSSAWPLRRLSGYPCLCPSGHRISGDPFLSAVSVELVGPVGSIKG
jgi:hypothetical protein